MRPSSRIGLGYLPENEKRKKQAIETANKTIADDNAAQETALRKEADYHITTRTAQLLYAW